MCLILGPAAPGWGVNPADGLRRQPAYVPADGSAKLPADCTNSTGTGGCTQPLPLPRPTFPAGMSNHAGNLPPNCINQTGTGCVHIPTWSRAPNPIGVVEVPNMVTFAVTTFASSMSGSMQVAPGSAADYDGDGDLDWFYGNALYRNDGNGVFTAVLAGSIGTQASIDAQDASSGGSSGGCVDSPPPSPPAGGGGGGGGEEGRRLSATSNTAYDAMAWGDLDNDGDVDMIVAYSTQEFGSTDYFRLEVHDNLGNSTFALLNDTHNFVGATNWTRGKVKTIAVADYGALATAQPGGLCPGPYPEPLTVMSDCHLRGDCP